MAMSTLIIPCAGKSTRFPNMKPKWLLTHPDGKLMIEKAISGMDLNSFERIIVTIVKQHADEYEADIMLKQVFKDRKFEVFVLNGFTKSPAETVKRTILENNVDGSFVVKDSDNCVWYGTKKGINNYVVGLNLNTFGDDVLRLKAKSFITLNDQNHVVDIIEKQIKSNLICVGVYGFGSVHQYLDALEYIERNSVIQKEIFLSHIMAYIIGAEKTYFHYIEADNYEDWGTLDDWKNVQKRYATYFIDVDGVILSNRGKYGKLNWSNSNELIVSNVEAIKILSQNGAQIIITTSRTKEYRAELEKLLEKCGIEYHEIIMGCNHAPRVIINDFAPTNPYPSCRAISLPRNSSLAHYLND